MHYLKLRLAAGAFFVCLFTTLASWLALIALFDSSRLNVTRLSVLYFWVGLRSL